MGGISKKYILRGGPIFSGEGNTHVISTFQLRRLYNLPSDLCVSIPYWLDIRNEMELKRYREEGLIELWPLGLGNYEEVLELEHKKFNKRVFEKHSESLCLE